MRNVPFAMLLLAALPACAAPDLALLRQQVRAAECSFAASMAHRDLAAFEAHVAEPAVFFGAKEPLQGRAAIVVGWKRYFDGAQAPFSWEPDQIVVVADGSLAWSSGLVRDPAGALIGRFGSVWRQEAPGQWRIILDRGVPLGDADRQHPQPVGAGCA